MPTTLPNTWIDPVTGDMSLDGDLTVWGSIYCYADFGAINVAASHFIGGDATLGGLHGVILSASNGVLTLAGLKSGGNNENLVLDFETTSNIVAITSSTGVTNLVVSGMGLDVRGTAATNIITADIGLDLNQVTAPASLTLNALQAGTSLEIGDYYYRIAYVTDLGQTNIYPLDTAGVTGYKVTTTAGNRKVLLNIPVSSDYRVTKRRLYRSKVYTAPGDQYTVRLCKDITNNTDLTVLDDVADASLGPLLSYLGNTTNTFITVDGQRAMILDFHNTCLGKNAGAALTTAGGRNIFIGANAGVANTTGSENTMIGQGAGASITTANGNIGIGSGAAGNAAGETVGIGYNSCKANASGNTGLGYVTLSAATSGGACTALGDAAGQACTGANCIFVGYCAGNAQTSGSGKLIIDSFYRAGGAASELTSAIIYGTMSATVSSQQLTFNVGSVTIAANGYLALSGTGYVDSPKYKAGGTNPVADGTYNFDGSAAGTVASMTIKGGIITGITTR